MPKISKIQKIEKLFIDYVCPDIPNAFWNRKQYTIGLPYEKNFDERNIQAKAFPILMNKEL